MAQVTTADGIRLGMDFLRRYHALECGTAAYGQNCRWSWNGEVFSSISYDLNLIDEQPYIRLYYTHAKTTRVDYKVRLVSTRPNYGGERWWFICPYTGQRCGVLYNPPGQPYFASRKAFGLAYACQNEDAASRALRRYQRKLESYGGEYGEPWFPRPKGMHHKTYQRRLAEVEALDRYSDAVFLATLGKRYRKLLG